MTISIFGIKITIKDNASAETKERVVRNIEKANSYDYRHQVASHHFVNSVIDDILSDPIWREVAEEALAARK